jgi:hypothetical protein
MLFYFSDLNCLLGDTQCYGRSIVRQVYYVDSSFQSPSTVHVESGDFDGHQFGDAIPEKSPGTFRFAFQNAGHFAASSADPRTCTARVAFNQLQFDCWAWAETNIRCQNVSQGGYCTLAVKSGLKHPPSQLRIINMMTLQVLINMGGPQ